MAGRDEGDFAGQPDHPLISSAAKAEAKAKPVRLDTLWEDCVKARQLVGRMKDGGRHLSLKGRESISGTTTWRGSRRNTC